VNKQVKKSKKNISDAKKVVEKNVKKASKSLGISDAIKEVQSLGSQIGQIGQGIQEVISFLTEE
jgi:transcriptional regulator